MFLAADSVDDLKLIELMSVIHSYLEYQVKITNFGVDEEEKLLYFSEFCEDVPLSIEFMPTLIYNMAMDMANAFEYCNTML